MRIPRLAATLPLVLLLGCGSSAAAPSDAVTDAVTAADTATATDAVTAADATTDTATATDTGPDVPWAPPDPTLWPANELPEIDGPFLDAHPELQPWSHWRTHLDGSPEPYPPCRARGAFGLGNGRVFATIGMGEPTNAVHGLAGPTYEQGENFYGDLAVGVTGPDGAGWKDFDEQWVMMSFGAPALFWRGVRGDLEVTVVDLVLWGDTVPDVARRAWLRTVLVRNRGAAAIDAPTLVVRGTGHGAGADGASLTQSRDGRRVVTFLDRDGATAAANGLTLPLSTLAPGAEERVLLIHLTMTADADEAAERAALLAAVAGDGLDGLSAGSAAALQAWWDGTVRLTTPDPMVDDLVRALALSIKYQLTASGATTAMSHYSGTWTRDNVGPLRSLLALGAHDDAAGVLDYYYRAVLNSGGLGNRYRCDLPIDVPLPAEPDWPNLPKGGERTAGEAPSYIPMMYGDYVAWTGDLDKASQRLGFLRYTLDTQTVSDDGLINWSGDETFRGAMNAALGLLIEYPLQVETWSPNSSLLFVAAAETLADLIHAGDPHAGEADAWQDRADVVWNAALDHLRLEDGCWSAFRFREAFGGEPSPGPFEDVALKEIWAGARDGDDPEAQARLQCLIDHTRQAPGILQSLLHPRYSSPQLFPFLKEGMYTGMLPGYTLFAFARAGHPEAEDAFDAVRLSADTGGFSTEYMVYDDHLPLQIVYDPNGTGVVDYTARFRPWEGGIVLHAVLDYVVGVQPQRDGRITFRPHLPNGWPSFTAEGVRVGAARFDLSVRRVGPDAVEIEITAHGEGSWGVAVRWDHGADQDFDVTGDYRVVDGMGENVFRHEHMGAASTELAGDVVLMGGEPMTVRFAPRP